MPGRKRTPTHLRLVQGNPGKRPTNEAREPRPKRLKAPKPPSHLTPRAAAMWRHVSRTLSDVGVLTVADLVTLERLCEAYAEVRTAQIALELLGGNTYETTSAHGGFMRRAHPEVAQLADADRRLRGYLAEFGMTPAARSKVSLPIGDSETDKLNHYFG